MSAPAPSFRLGKRRPRHGERAVTWLLRLSAYTIVLAASAIFLIIAWRGAQTVFTTVPPFVNIEFLTGSPETLYVFEQGGRERQMGAREYLAHIETAPDPITNLRTYNLSAGGIFPNIVGTVLLVIGSMVLAMFLGVCSAIYLSEYSRGGPFINLIRLAIINLAGVPSIVFGLFGYAMFVLLFGWDVSLMAGWFTLAFMVLPVIITASEEALRAVPQGFREGALALGATRWQAIRTNVLPYALPGILTSSILGIARVAGETAPIMFTAAFIQRSEMPWNAVDNPLDIVWEGVMALPYHIYVVSSKIPQNVYTERVQYGAAFVFLALVMLIALASVVLRAKMRENKPW